MGYAVGATSGRNTWGLGMSARCHRPEQAIQRAAVQYLRLMENLGELTFFHVPNGGRRSKVEAGIFKGLGVRAGVPDLVLLFPGGRTAFIELKAEGGRLSTSQRAFRNTVEYLGFPYAECRDLNAVELFVRELIAAPIRRDAGAAGMWPSGDVDPKASA